MLNSTSSMKLHFISNAKKQGNMENCKVVCSKNATTTSKTINTANTTTSSPVDTTADPNTDKKCRKYKLYETTMIRRVKSWSDCRDECNVDESCEYFEYKVEFYFKYENCQALKNVAKNLINVYFPTNI